MRIGIDVGGTHTDAVLMDGETVAAATKGHNTDNLADGTRAALNSLRQDHPFSSAEIDGVMIGTTHLLNALVEAHRLAHTAAIRLCLPATAAFPPFTEWPQRLKTALGATGHMVPGGHEYTGRRIASLDERGLRRLGERLGEEGVESIAVSSVFSPVNAELEEQAAAVLAEVLPGVPVSLSHRIGRIGLLERENATIINASLRLLAGSMTNVLSQVILECGITAPLFLSQNDGTVMDVNAVQEYPVLTFASGPANSMRGAAVLSGLQDCAVVDCGGTTSDVGMLRGGFPRETPSFVDVAGLPTNFRMPDVVSIGLGGGSRVNTGGDLRVGPDSVGHRLGQEALIFGGKTLTTTDIAVAAGRAQLGDHSCVTSLEQSLVQAVLNEIDQRHIAALESMRSGLGEMPVVCVGGGAVLLPDYLKGIGPVIRPEHYAVANAVGAAVAQVSGEVDRIFIIGSSARQEVLQQARQEATDRAVASGAAPASVRIVDEDAIPVPYLPSEAVRIKVKAVGDLRIGRSAPRTEVRG